MEELAKLEAERGTPGYISEGENAFVGERKRLGETKKHAGTLLADGSGRRHDRGSMSDGLGAVNVRKRERVASNEMCTFLILNISSLQLIPVNMIAYRQQYGSVNPAGIIAPAIVATFLSTAVAMIYCKIMDRKQ